MQIYPAIDLRGGQCVRLLQGDFAQTTVYASTPQAMLAQFATCGCQWAHIVDLDGAKAGSLQQIELIAQLAESTSLQLEVGVVFAPMLIYSGCLILMWLARWSAVFVSVIHH